MRPQAADPAGKVDSANDWSKQVSETASCNPPSADGTGRGAPLAIADDSYHRCSRSSNHHPQGGHGSAPASCAWRCADEACHGCWLLCASGLEPSLGPTPLCSSGGFHDAPSVAWGGRRGRRGGMGLGCRDGRGGWGGTTFAFRGNARDVEFACGHSSALRDKLGD